MIALLHAASAAARVELHTRSDGSLLLRNSITRAVEETGGSGIRADAASLRQLILREARRWNLDPQLVTAVIVAESGFDPSAVSRKGAVGLMQLMPATSRRLSVDDPYDPAENVAGGARYLRELLDRFGGSLELALAGYNAGPGAVVRYRGIPPYRETRGYVAKVLRLYRGPDHVPDFAGIAASGRRTFLRRDFRGRLLLTTAPN
jgi:soluble lytic murein transglycosylase-like protein